MEITLNKTKIILKRGDITEEDTDAIVNAANSRLAGGSGVDGAIHRAGGKAIMLECKTIGSCPTGEAVITSAGRLRARYVIHTVGPIYRAGHSNEETLLRNAYNNSLTLALSKGLKTISLPSISTGAYGYPIKQASIIAIDTIINFCREFEDLNEIRLILFSDKALEIYSQSLKELQTRPPHAVIKSDRTKRN